MHMGVSGKGGAGGRDALEGKGPQGWPQKQLDRRLKEVAKAVGGGYCQLQMPAKPARRWTTLHLLGPCSANNNRAPNNGEGACGRGKGRPNSGELSEGAGGPLVDEPCLTPPPTKSDWIAPTQRHVTSRRSGNERRGEWV